MTGINVPYSQYKYPTKTNDSFERKNSTQSDFTEENKTDEKNLNKVKVEIQEIKDTFKSFTNAVQDIDKLTKTQQKTNTAAESVMTGTISMIPGLRRVPLIEDNAEGDNKIKVVGLTALALINAEEDLRDLHAIFGRVKTNAQPGYYAKFGFFTGTTLEKWLRKTKNGKTFIKIFDKTLGDFEITQSLLGKIGVTREEVSFRKKIVHFSFRKLKYFILDKGKHPRMKTFIQKLRDNKGDDSAVIKAMKYVQKKCSKNHIKIETVKRKSVKYTGALSRRLLGYALDRIPVLSIVVAALLEIPAITEAVKERDDKKQIVKSGLSLSLSISIGALLSAAGAMASFIPIIGPALPIIGLGVGFFLGNTAAKKINEKI